MTKPEVQHGHNNQTNREMKTGSQTNERGRQKEHRETQNAGNWECRAGRAAFSMSVFRAHCSFITMNKQ